MEISVGGQKLLRPQLRVESDSVVIVLSKPSTAQPTVNCQAGHICPIIGV